MHFRSPHHFWLGRVSGQTQSANPVGNSAMVGLFSSSGMIQGVSPDFGVTVRRSRCYSVRSHGIGGWEHIWGVGVLVFPEYGVPGLRGQCVGGGLTGQANRLIAAQHTRPCRAGIPRHAASLSARRFVGLPWKGGGPRRRCGRGSPQLSSPGRPMIEPGTARSCGGRLPSNPMSGYRPADRSMSPEY